MKPEVIKLLDRFKILNEREVHARYEIFLENYNKTINVEGQLMVLMANRYILPAAFEYQKQIGQSVAAVKAGRRHAARRARSCSRTYTKLVDKFKAQSDVLAAASTHASNGSAEKHAKYMRDKVVPGDGQAARDWRRDRSQHAARALAAADVSRNVVREVDRSNRSTRSTVRLVLGPAGKPAAFSIRTAGRRQSPPSPAKAGTHPALQGCRPGSHATGVENRNRIYGQPFALIQNFGRCFGVTDDLATRRDSARAIDVPRNPPRECS